jgi:hypothetical protein
MMHFKIYDVQHSNLMHAACGNNVSVASATVDRSLVDCPACLRGLAKRDRQTTQRAQMVLGEVSEREFAAILAGLRLLQVTICAGMKLDPQIQELLNNGGLLVQLQVTHPFTQPDEYDLLCERLNSQAGKQ